MNTPGAVGVILAGGKSKRMGTDKALVELSGRPMYSWVADALRSAGCEVVVAGRKHLGDLPCYPDIGDGPVGPLAGLVSMGPVAGGRPIVLAATDHPLLRTGTVKALLELDDPIVAPVDADVAQVTCAVYRTHQIDRNVLEQAHSIQDLIRRVPTRRVAKPEWTSWGEDGRSWFSVDTAEALARAASWPQP
jgi:molybdopterin-guanine dinucleotide biosynthesis protein A